MKHKHNNFLILTIMTITMITFPGFVAKQVRTQAWDILSLALVISKTILQKRGK